MNRRMAMNSLTRVMAGVLILILSLLFVAGRADANSVTILVPADAGWFDTDIDVKQGETVRLFASGLWGSGGYPAAPYTGPDGFTGALVPTAMVPDAPYGSLVGRIGDKTFKVGAEAVQSFAGRLFLALNDTPDGAADNQGYMVVTIEKSTKVRE